MDFCPLRTMSSPLAKDLLETIENLYRIRCQLESVSYERRRTRGALSASNRKLRRLEEQFRDVSQNVLDLKRTTRSFKNT